MNFFAGDRNFQDEIKNFFQFLTDLRYFFFAKIWIIIHRSQLVVCGCIHLLTRVDNKCDTSNNLVNYKTVIVECNVSRGTGKWTCDYFTYFW